MTEGAEVMRPFIASAAREFLLPFFTALGVIIGGSVIGSLASFFAHGSPLATMNQLARSLRLWAVMIGIGGTFNVIKGIESGVFEGQPLALVRQLLVFTSGYLGAFFGYWVVVSLSGGE